MSDPPSVPSSNQSASDQVIELQKELEFIKQQLDEQKHRNNVLQAKLKKKTQLLSLVTLDHDVTKREHADLLKTIAFCKQELLALVDKIDI